MRFNKTIRLTTSLLVCIQSLTPSFADAPPASDQRTVIFVMPRMVDAVICDRTNCHGGVIPASYGSPFYYTRTATEESNGRWVGSETVRVGPSSYEDVYGKPFPAGAGGNDSEIINGAVFSFDPSRGPQGNIRSYSLGGDNSGLGKFLSDHGAAIGAGMKGAMDHYKNEQAAQERQAQAALELDAAFRSGRAVNGQYVYVSLLKHAQDEQIGKALSQATWISTGVLAGTTGILASGSTGLAAHERYNQIAHDSFAIRRYVLNETARNNIANSIRTSLVKRNFDRAAADLEGLQYDPGTKSLPQDLANLVNRSGVLVFERLPQTVGFEIPTSPLADSQLRTKLRSDEGQLVRRIANRFQAAWANSQGLKQFRDQNKVQYVTGLGYLRSADEALASGQLSGQIDLRVADILLQSALGFSTGVVSGVEDLVRAVPEIAKMLAAYPGLLKGDPLALIRFTNDLAMSLPAIASATWQSAKSAFETVKSGSAYDRAHLAGRLTFDFLLAYATGGSNALARGLREGITNLARAKPALRTLLEATESVRAFQTSSLATHPELRRALSEVGKLPQALSRDLSQAARRDPERALDALSIYRQTLLSVPNASAREAAVAARAALSTENAAARKFLKSVIASQDSPENAAKYFQKASDSRQLIKEYESVFQDLAAHRKSMTLEGFQARVGDPKFIPMHHPEKAFNIHIGNTTSSNRMGVGGKQGQFVQSFGFGTTKEEALLVAQSELRSRGLDPSTYPHFSASIKAENILDLTKELDWLKSSGIREDVLRLNRDLPEAYKFTNMIGHAAKQLEFDGILTPSAAIERKSVFHRL